MKNITCKICNHKTGNKKHLVPEMMFGFDEKFEYIECDNCGCLQIEELPKKLSKYYPKKYYSFDKIRLNNEFILSFLREHSLKYYLHRKDLIGFFLTKIFGAPNYFEWIKNANLNLKSKILDVGCGAGHLLISLQRSGFKKLIGVDPYIGDNIFYKNGVKIYKKEIFNLNDKFDFIILNHCFEHMIEPQKIIQKIYNLLNKGGVLLIRLPVKSSYAWEHYGINWVQLDAPRHVFLPTAKSMKILAENNNFELKKTVYDSWEFQFWGSEQYVKNIPLRSKKSYAENAQESIFNKKEINNFKKKAIELNNQEKGDMASFYLYKK